ncbi:MAG: pentapeptide repeat-containing protein [Candidatus Parabeggiatoa sp.]
MTTIYDVLIFVISKLTLVALIFYFTPLWKIIVIQFADIEPALITSPPWWAFLLYVFTLIAITYLLIQADAKKTTQFIESQTDIKDLKAFSDKGEKTSKNVPPYKMRKPDEFSQESDLFYERIKRIFLYRRGCDLSADHDNEILYGEIDDFGEKTPIFIQCDSSGFHDIESNIKALLDWIAQFYERKQATLVKGYQKIFYIHLDSVSISSSADLSEIIKTNDIKIRSETGLVESNVPVTAYLNKIIQEYKTKKLPFSLRTEEEKQFSLADTFVPPSFNHRDLGINDPIALENYLDQWINEDASPKQMAILGGYGTGKSSFLFQYAAKLAEDYVPGKSRIPVLISLTNVSPMLDWGLKDRLSKTADEMGIRYDSLMYLIEKKKVVLMLDGFDEMGYVGNNEFRIKHFESIWQLATQGNKIIIAGRPSYFFNEEELNKALQSVEEGDLISDDLPHCRLIKLETLSFTEIKAYLSKYFTPDEVEQYADFIQARKQLLDLASRPSLMHIIREMIPEIYQAYHNEQQSNKRYSAGYLMEKYAHNWVTRQANKQITGSLSNQDKNDFFEQLAENFYLNQNEVIVPHQVEELMPEFLKQIDFSDPEKKDGILGDILSGSFLQRQASNSFKFVHRSFFEYFVAKRIVTYITNEKAEATNELPKIFFAFWREEIASFVADLLPQNQGSLPSNVQNNNFYEKANSLLNDLSQIEFEKSQQAWTKKGFFKAFYSNFILQLKLISLKNEFRRLSRIVIREDKNVVSFEKFSIVKKARENEKLFEILITTIITTMATTIVGVANLIFFQEKIIPPTFFIFIFILTILLILILILIVLFWVNKKEKNSHKSTAMELFRTAIVNNANVSFFRKESIKDFMSHALFIFLIKHLFVKSGALAKHDFSQWDLWLGEDKSIDLSGADLQGANFSHANLQNVNFEGANLKVVNFQNANLKNANLKNANLEGANLTNTNLEGTILQRT